MDRMPGGGAVLQGCARGISSRSFAEGRLQQAQRKLRAIEAALPRCALTNAPMHDPVMCAGTR